MTPKQIIAMLDEYYNRSKPLSENVINLYLDGLSNIDTNILERVAREWVQTGKPFMPKIAELRAEADKIHVDRFIDGRRVILDLKDYFQTEEFKEVDGKSYRMTYRVLKPREFDKVIAER